MKEEQFKKTHENWENLAVRELYREYQNILFQQNIKMPQPVIELHDLTSQMGEWSSQCNCIRISRNLLLEHSWWKVVGVLKHEMAHQLTEMWGAQDYAHGESFKLACKRLGVPEEFCRSRVDLQKKVIRNSENNCSEVENRLFIRVQKLLSLATSANEYEAIAAMKKVRELYAKYNLENIEKSNFVHIYIPIQSTKINIQIKKIASLLTGHFFVQVILGTGFNVKTGKQIRCVEIIGKSENARMAEYVFGFLIQQIEYLYEQNLNFNKKRNSRLVKKSYQLGILTGFEDKLSQQVSEFNNLDTNIYKNNIKVSTPEDLINKALIYCRTESGLNEYIGRVYPRLTNISSRGSSLDKKIYHEGRSEGRKIVLNKAVNEGTSKKFGGWLTNTKLAK